MLFEEHEYIPAENVWYYGLIPETAEDEAIIDRFRFRHCGKMVVAQVCMGRNTKDKPALVIKLTEERK